MYIHVHVRLWLERNWYNNIIIPHVYIRRTLVYMRIQWLYSNHGHQISIITHVYDNNGKKKKTPFSHLIFSLYRQELLSAQDRISHLHDRLAMSRLQSRGSTPSRPSPSSESNFVHGAAPFELYGRHSPTKAVFGGRGLIQPHRTASFSEPRNQGTVSACTDTGHEYVCMNVLSISILLSLNWRNMKNLYT